MISDHIIFLSYGAPIVLLSVLTFVSIVSIRERFSATFFTINMMTSAVNLMTYINVWLTLRLFQEPAFNFYYHFINWTVVLPPVHMYLIGFFYFAQNINSALMVIDRYVAIAALEWTDTWRRRWWQLAVLLYALSGVAYFVAAGFYDSKYMYRYLYVATTDTFVYSSVDAKHAFERAPVFLILQAISGLIFIAFCAIVNVLTWIRLRRLKTTKKADRSLFFISLVIFISQTVNILILVLEVQFYVISYNREMFTVIVYIMQYTSDVFSLGPGLYMLLIPGPIRRRSFAILMSFFSGSTTLSKSETHSSTVQTIKI